MFRAPTFLSKKYFQSHNAPQLYNYYVLNYSTGGSGDNNDSKKQSSGGLFGARRDTQGNGSQSSKEQPSERRSLFSRTDAGERRPFGNRSSSQKSTGNSAEEQSANETRKSPFGKPIHSQSKVNDSKDNLTDKRPPSRFTGGSLFGRPRDTTSSQSDEEKPRTSLFGRVQRDAAQSKGEGVPQKSLFSNVGLFGKAKQAPASDESSEEPKVRRPLFSSVSSPFAKPASGPERTEAPQDVIGKDPKTPAQLEKGIPKTSMYGVEHDDRLKREIERARLLRTRTQEQLKVLAQKANVIQKHNHWKNIDTDTLRREIFKKYNEQRYDMLKPLLDLVEEVEELESQRREDEEAIDAMELQSIDDEVNGFLNKNPKIKEITGNRLNPWSLIEDPKLAKQLLNRNTLEMYGYNLLNKLDFELESDSAAERTILGFVNLNEIRESKNDYEAYKFAAELINTNIPDDDVAKDEWEELKEDMARVLELDLQDMKSKRLLTMNPIEPGLNQSTSDHLQIQAKTFLEKLKQKSFRDDAMALESFKLRQDEEESLIKALRSRDKVALIGDLHGGTLIGLSNHILVYEAQMRQIIRDHNKRLRLLRDAREKYSNQFKILRIEDTNPLTHIGKYKNKQLIAPLYKHVERFVDRIPESLAKRRLASHARVIMSNKYLTMEEKKTMVGNLAQVYHKYRLHLHMVDATPRPRNTTHIHNEIRRFGGL